MTCTYLIGQLTLRISEHDQTIMVTCVKINDLGNDTKRSIHHIVYIRSMFTMSQNSTNKPTIIK